MRRAFLSDTEYQTFNLLNFYDHLTEKGEADFYLCDFFPSAKSLYKRIPEEFAFSGLILYSPHEPSKNESRIHWYLRHARGYLSPKETIEDSILDGHTDFYGYDEIYASTMTMFVTDLLQLNPQATLYMIDEGVGGYAGDPLTGHLSWRQRLFAKVFKRGAAVVKPQCVFMYQVENAKKHTTLPIRPMPQLDEEFLGKARRLFDTEKSEAYEPKKKLLWLTHPPDALDKGTESIDQIVCAFLKQYKDQILVRQHPRDRRDDFYKDYSVDHSGQMWELMIPLMDMENMTLIGTFSTAQMTPKMLYDMEPRILFLCPIYREIYGRELYEEIIEAVQEFRSIYRNPERVILVENMEMLQRILEDLI